MRLLPDTMRRTGTIATEVMRNFNIPRFLHGNLFLI